jgi:hypothetical protein
MTLEHQHYTEIVSNGGARVKWLAPFRATLWVLAASIGLAMFGALAAHARPFDPSGSDWEGYADVVRLMRNEVGSNRLIVTNHLDWKALDAQDALVIVYPEHGLDVDSAGAFVRAGGRLALFDDFGAGDGLLASFDIHRVALPSHPALALRDNPDLPIAEPGTNEQPLTRGVDRVVTNHASGVQQPLLSTVLRVRATDGADVPLALSASSGAGRLLVVGDPSVAMNSMLRYPGNRELAKNVVQYLIEGHPTGRIYLVIGAFAESGAFAGAGGAAHEWLAALGQAREAITRDGFPAWILYWFTFIVAISVFVWLMPRAARTYRGESPRFTRPIPPEAQGGAAGHAASLRSKATYRGLAMLEWKRALIEDLTFHFGIPSDSSPAEVVRRVGRLGVVEGEALRAIERVLLRMAEIEIMIAAKQTNAIQRIRDEEVVAAGALVKQVLATVHRRDEQGA